jgi:hypothetical protein
MNANRTLLLGFSLLLTVAALVPRAARAATGRAPGDDVPAPEAAAGTHAGALPDPAPGNPRHGASAAERWLDLQVVFQSLVVWKNDADFDPTALSYDADGQSVGLLGTFLKPRLTLSPLAELAIVYEIEVGLNLWSLNDPDQYATGELAAFRLAHRELYADVALFDGRFGFRVGYQYLTDPTALALGHWIGAAGVWGDLGPLRLTLLAGQLPEQTFEGVVLESENNFRHDAFVYGLRADVPLGPWSVHAAVLGLHDGQFVDQTLDLMTASVRTQVVEDTWNAGLDLAFQYGVTEEGAQGGDETTIAWAVQAWASAIFGPVELTLNQLLLSPDDTHDRNDTNGAFFYAAKPRSRTLLLTEDELRDRSTNLDERMAERRGKLFLLRPGLSLTDLTVRWRALDWFVPALTVGAAFTLEPDNALGGRYVGTELDLTLGFHYRDVLAVYLAGVALVPGRAAAAFANLHDRTATEPMFMVEGSLFLYY